MKEKLLALLTDIRPDVEFEKEKKLIDDGVLDSFDIISIVQEMNEGFDIDIDVEELEPYNFNTILAGTEALQGLLKIEEFKDAQAGLNFHGTGKLITPLGDTLIHVPTMEPKKIIGLDKNCALEMVQAGEIITDYDKLSDRQMERAGISAIAGFAQIYGDAAKGLSY